MLFLQTFDAVSRYSETQLAKEGISKTRYTVLVMLDNAQAPPTLTELSRWMFRSKNSTTTVIDHMERDGLVQRVRDARDGRSVRVAATEAGRELFDQVRQPSRELVYRIMACFEEEDKLDRFAELLRMLRENVLQELAGDSGLKPVALRGSEHIREGWCYNLIKTKKGKGGGAYTK